jgi:hypothetical protein
LIDSAVNLAYFSVWGGVMTFLLKNLLKRANPNHAGRFAMACMRIVIFSLAICAVSHAQIVTVAYEGFNYSSGSLAGDNGGTGWTTAWTHTYTPGGNFDVSTTGLTYAGLSTTGGSIVWGSGGSTGISEDTRTLPLQNSGVVYLQFLSQFGPTSSGGGTPNIRLLNSGTLTGGFGSNGGSLMAILDSSLLPNSSSSTASLSNLNFVIAQIDYQANTTQMWVNPDLSTFDYQNPTAPDAAYAGLAPEFDAIAIYSRSPANLDEIKVMVISVPEPSSTILLGMGIILWGLYRRIGKAQCKARS